MAATWAVCEVWRAGAAENGVIFVYLKEQNNDFSAWFKATPGVKNQILATALSAVSLDKKVNVLLTDTAAYSTINRLYIMK